MVISLIHIALESLTSRYAAPLPLAAAQPPVIPPVRAGVNVPLKVGKGSGVVLIMPRCGGHVSVHARQPFVTLHGTALEFATKNTRAYSMLSTPADDVQVTARRLPFENMGVVTGDVTSCTKAPPELLNCPEGYTISRPEPLVSVTFISRRTTVWPGAAVMTHEQFSAALVGFAPLDTMPLLVVMLLRPLHEMLRSRILVSGQNWGMPFISKERERNKR